ncbi:MAG TPA: hypothetical protein VHP31_08860 [Caproicibacter sp.]|nr:hypothetical protein [Caproicibacter sp.]
MKKLFSVVLSCLLLFLAARCGFKEPKSVSSRTASHDTALSSMASSEAAVQSISPQAVPTVSAMELPIPSNAQPTAIVNGEILYGIGTANATAYYMLQSDFKKTREVGEIENWDTDSDDIAIVGNRYIYRMPSVKSNGKMVNSLFQIDTQSNRITKMLDADFTIPLCYFSVLNNRDIFMFNPSSFADGFHYYIYKIDLERRRLISMKETTATASRGERMNGVVCNDGKIYLMNSQSDKTYILVYDSKFVLQRKIRVPELDGSSTLKMKIIGNIFYFENITGSSLFFYDGSGLRKFWSAGYNFSLVETDRGMDKTFPYVYLYERDKSFLYVLNLFNKTVTKIELNLDPDYEEIALGKADEKGNAILQCKQGGENGSSYKTYFIKSGNVLNYLKNAKPLQLG